MAAMTRLGLWRSACLSAAAARSLCSAPTVRQLSRGRCARRAAQRGRVSCSRGVATLSEQAPSFSWAAASASGPAPKRARVPREEVSYSVVIESCARKGDARGAAGWLEEMASSPFKPNVFAFNAVIAGFARKAKAVEAADWLGRMMAEGLEPNVVSYTAVIDGCAMAGDAAGAARWFDEMLEKGVVPNNMTYNALINSCARHGDVDGALKWLERMRTPDVISYNSAINSCANARPPRPKDAESLFHELRDAGFEPTASTLTSLERAVGVPRSLALCSSLGVDPKKARAKRPPQQHRRVRPMTME